MLDPGGAGTARHGVDDTSAGKAWTVPPVIRASTPGSVVELRIFGKLKGGGVDSAAPFAHLDARDDIPATGRSVGAKPTRRLADEPNFPDLSRWQFARLRRWRDPRRGRRRHLAIAREK